MRRFGEAGERGRAKELRDGALVPGIVHPRTDRNPDLVGDVNEMILRLGMGRRSMRRWKECGPAWTASRGGRASRGCAWAWGATAWFGT